MYLCKSLHARITQLERIFIVTGNKHALLNDIIRELDFNVIYVHHVVGMLHHKHCLLLMC